MLPVLDNIESFTDINEIEMENCIHYEIPEYTLFYIDRVNKQGRDVALYANHQFNCHIVALFPMKM